jgi:uncharacterized protein YodC (DUF2158 family)
MEKIFTIGDVVKLKSGGPVMTVDSFDENNSRVWCIWFDEKKTMQTAKFVQESLTKYTPPSRVSYL